MPELTDEIRRAYAEAWYRTIGMEEHDVAAMSASEVADPMPWRDAALRAVLAVVERDTSSRYARLLDANRMLVDRVHELDGIEDERDRALGRLDDAIRKLAKLGAERPREGCPYCMTGLADHCPYHDRMDGSQ